MQLAIVQNPHSKDPKALWRTLDELDRNNKIDDELDKNAFKAFKATMQTNPKIIVK